MLKIRKLGFFVALILSTRVKYLDLSLLNNFTTVSLALLLSLLTILLLLTLNIFGANFLDDLVVFNK